MKARPPVQPVLQLAGAGRCLRLTQDSTSLHGEEGEKVTQPLSDRMETQARDSQPDALTSGPGRWWWWRQGLPVGWLAV